MNKKMKKVMILAVSDWKGLIRYIPEDSDLWQFIPMFQQYRYRKFNVMKYAIYKAELIRVGKR